MSPVSFFKTTRWYRYLFNTLWVMSMAAVAAAGLYGVVMQAAITTSVLVGCFLAAFPVGLACLQVVLFQDNIGLRRIKWLWLLIALFTLVFTLLLSYQTAALANDVDAVLVYSLLVLGFPASFMVPYLIFWTDLPALFINSYLLIGSIWALLTLTGYVQWFVVLPKLRGWIALKYHF